MAKGTYAATTTVTIGKSQDEIKNTLRKYGAERLGIMEDMKAGYVMFEYSGLTVQMEVPFPSKDEFKKSETGRSRTTSVIENHYEQALRQRWRALLLAIKAKLEAVELGISSIEEEFLAFIKMPNGISFGDTVIPKIQEIANTGKMPTMIGMGN